MKVSLNDLFVGNKRKMARLTLAVCAVLCVPMAAVSMQTPPARVLGTVTAIEGHTVSVKTDAGTVEKVTVQDATRMVQTAPGQTNLSSAAVIHVQDLEVGDRISARGTMSEDGASLTAVSLIAMKQADVQKKQETDREDWQKRGISGVVKQVDAAGGTVTVSTGAGAAARMLTVRTAKTTVIRRYASDSAKLIDAKPSSLDQMKTGDQLRARGTRNSDETELTAEEIVTGSFRNVAGIITAVDKGAGTISLTDLATKKPYVILCTADSQLRKLPPMMAQMLAARLKASRPGVTGGSSTAAAGKSSAPGNSAPGNSAPNTTAQNKAVSGTSGEPANAQYANGQSGSGESGGGEHTGPRDPQQVLSRAPAILLADLQKGDAVMIVTTEGAAAAPGEAATSTAITLIAGVEPMLQASASGSQSLLSSSWSLGSGGAGGEGSQ